VQAQYEARVRPHQAQSEARSSVQGRSGLVMARAGLVTAQPAVAYVLSGPAHAALQQRVQMRSSEPADPLQSAARPARADPEPCILGQEAPTTARARAGRTKPPLVCRGDPAPMESAQSPPARRSKLAATHALVSGFSLAGSAAWSQAVVVWPIISSQVTTHGQIEPTVVHRKEYHHIAGDIRVRTLQHSICPDPATFPKRHHKIV
jgi:hypothetical protein